MSCGGSDLCLRDMVFELVQGVAGSQFAKPCHPVVIPEDGS